MTSRNCSGVSRVAGYAVPLPALLTSTSTWPNSAIAASTTAWQSSTFATSAVTVSARRPRSSIWALVSWRRSAATRGEHEVGTGLGERLRERDAEPGRGAGDDRHLAVEAEKVEHGSRHAARPITARLADAARSGQPKTCLAACSPRRFAAW